MATLTIPGNTISHVLPQRFHFLSKGVNDGNTDLVDSTYLAYVKALKPEGWRLISAYYPLGTPTSPVTGDGVGPFEFGQHGTTTNWPDVLYADHNAHFLFTFNGGPPARPSTSTNAFDTSNYSASNTVEGSPANCADWLTDWQLKFPGNVRGVEYWNEPTNAGKITPTSNRSWFPAAPNGDFLASTYADVMARRYYTALDAVRRPEVLLCHSAFGNSSDRNGVSDFQKLIFGSGAGAYGSSWPWGSSSNLAFPAFDCVTIHAYGAPAGNYQPRDQSIFNTFLYPPATWGTSGKGGYLGALDYIRGQLNGNGGANVQIGMSEIEPGDGNAWGATGKGVAHDTVVSIISGNRQGVDKIAFQVMMDVMRDTYSLQGLVGDQMLCKSGSSGWIRAPRYWGAKDLWGKFLKQYKRIVTVPMYTGDTAACTWTVAPGVTPQTSVNGAAYDNSVQRIQALVGYDTSGNMGILLVDAALTGAAEQLTVNLPFNPTAATATVCPAGYSLTADTTFPASQFTVTNQTFTTGTTASLPALAPGTSMLIELSQSGGGPPPPPPPPPPTSGMKISTVADDANDNVLSGIWLTTDGSTANITFSETNGRWEFVCGSGALSTHYYELRSALTNYDCTTDSCSIQAVTANTFLQLHQQGSSTIYVGLRVTGGNLEAFKHISASDVVLGSTAWNATTMAYLRIREASGTTFWEYATTPAATWTTLFSVASPMTMSQVQIRFGATGATASTTVILDNLNTVGINSTDIGAWATDIGVNATNAISPPVTTDIGEWSTAVLTTASILFSLSGMGNTTTSNRDPSGT